jgi:glycosyltransferase involved in cell wall biosynthesis
VRPERAAECGILTDRVLVVSVDYGSPTGGAAIAERVSRLLTGEFDLRVVRLCDETRPGDLPWTRFADSRSSTFIRDGVPVIQLGPPPERAPLLRALTRASQMAPPLRLALSWLLAVAVRPALGRELAAADVVHLYYGGLPVFTRQLMRQVAAHRLPVVLTPFLHLQRRGRRARLPRRLGSLVVPALCREVAAVVAMTEFERQWLIAQGVAAERCVVAPGAPSLEAGQTPDPLRFRRAHGLGDDPVVLFLGRLTRAKGVERLARAAPFVWRAVPRARFVFIGPSAQGETDPRWFEDPRVLALDWLGAEKADALAACSLLCLPSEQESLGLVYLEAWALGKPVIALRLPVLERVIDDGHDGLLVDRTPEAVAQAIVQLLAAPERACRMGMVGRRKVERDFSWERTAARVAAVYRRAIVEARNGAEPAGKPGPIFCE